MKAEMEKAAKEMKTLQEELQAVQFSQDSKAGRMLMAKCRALQVLCCLTYILVHWYEYLAEASLFPSGDVQCSKAMSIGKVPNMQLSA